MNTPTNVNAGECSPASPCSALSDEDKQELIRLAWKAGFHAETPTQKEGIEKALMLAVSEGWNAESEDDVDYAYASIL
jgi:hypothetical protein